MSKGMILAIVVELTGIAAIGAGIGASSSPRTPIWAGPW